MQRSHQDARIYDGIEALLKTVTPEGCRIFHANMPLQVMDQLQRESAQLCTYLVQSDVIRRNSSGATPVHEVTIEVSFYGSLADVDDMASDLNALLVGNEIEAQGWRFCLYPAPQTGKRDIWEPRIQVKREWLQFRGFAIEPDETQEETWHTSSI